MSMIKTVYPSIAFFVSLLFTTTASSQNFEWAGSFGGDGEDAVIDLHVDAAGNSYATGYFTDEADFDISETEFNATSAGFYDVFIQKTNTHGEFQWVKIIGGDPFEYATGICSDEDGNVYVTGVFENTIDFDPGEGVFELTSSGGIDIFILKLDSQGEFVWAVGLGGSDYEEATEVEIDHLGNVVLLGYFYAQMDFDPSESEYLITPEGFSDSFIMKLGAENGDFLFARSFGGSDLDLAMDMEIAANGDIFVTGFFQGTSDFDPDPLIENLKTAGQFGSSGYVLQLKPNGGFVTMIHTLGGDVNCRGIAVDTEGNSYVTGTYSSTVDFDSDPDNGEVNTYTSNDNFNGFVMRILEDGAFDWVRPIDCDSPLFSYSIAVSSYGNVFSSGYFSGTADFDGDANSDFELTKITSNASEAYLLEMTNEGEFVSANQYGGANFLDAHSMGIDGANNVYLSAHFETTVDINPLPDANLEVTANNFRDNYLIKLSPNSSNVEGVTEDLGKKTFCFPNPTHGVVKITSDRSLKNTPYEIHSIGGRLIKSGLVTSNNIVEFNEISEGVYFLSLGEGVHFTVIKE